ncbi:MAG: lipopolysaccharide assembly protein LapB [Wenzhouxiangella sp.]
MIELGLLFLLLPAAAISGWLIGRKSAGSKGKHPANFSSQYFRGLNYLLNEESDKAIETFVKLAEINADTVDTHLALGTLFRRRGELDKAIRYHKHILSRPNLADEQRESVLFELALDYMRSGLLDRAELLFLDLTESPRQGETARVHLLEIYQQTKDWTRAIEQAQALPPGKAGSNAELIAHLYCELADQARAAGQPEEAKARIRQARRYYPGNARARLIDAGLAMDEGAFERASEWFREACELDPELLVSQWERLHAAHQSAGLQDELLRWLRGLHEKSGLLTPALTWASLQSEHEPKQAAEYLLRVLEQRPTARGLELLTRLMAEHGANLDDLKPELIRQLMQRLIADQPVYRCRQCGFSGTAHHWQCPGCRSWNSTRLIRGVMGA